MTEAEKKAERKARAIKAAEMANLLQGHLEGVDTVIVGAVLTKLVAIWTSLHSAEDGDAADTIMIRLKLLSHMAATAMTLADIEDERRTKH